MIKVNIKEEVKDLEEDAKKRFNELDSNDKEAVESFKSYETQIIPFYDGQNRTHKHIFIPALNKHYVMDNQLNWYLLEDKCDYCN